MSLTIVQTLPALEVGGVERGTLEVASELVKRGHRSIVISAGGRLVKELLASGSEHIEVAIGHKSPMTLLKVKQLRHIIEQESVDIVHTRSRLPAWISYLAWRGAGNRDRCGFVTTVHGPYSVNRYSRIMTRGQRVIAISNWIKDYIQSNYPATDVDRIRVIHRGVDAAAFPYGYTPEQCWLKHWRTQHPQLQDQFIVTLPARITRWKGQEDFLQVIKHARDKGIPVHGLLAGGPHPRRQNFFQSLQAMIRDLGLGQHVTVLGHRDDMREIMAISDVVCSLAREPEAFGRTALEALALGKPVVAYDHGGATEVLGSLFPQGLVSPLDTAAAGDKIAAFHQAPPTVANDNPFTLQTMLDETLKVYTELQHELVSRAR